jgi:hypothetical protein
VCLTELRILSRLTFRQITLTTTPGGIFSLPDMSRSWMFWIYQNNSQLPVYHTPAIASGNHAPASNMIKAGSGTMSAYTRESLGPLVRLPLYASDSNASGTANLFVFEMDEESMRAIENHNL